MITEILKNRFYENMTRHPDLKWDFVEARLNENKEVPEVLKWMEESGGEPDTIGIDEFSGKIIFCDCWKKEKRTLLWAAPCISLRKWGYPC